MTNCRRHEPEFPWSDPGRELDDDLKSEEIIDLLFDEANQEDNFGAAVNKMLRIIGEQTAADRCYVCKYQNDDFSGIEKVFEWFDPAVTVEMPESELACFAGYHNEFLKPRPILRTVALEGQAIQARILLGVRTAKRLYGFVGIDSTLPLEQFGRLTSRVLKAFCRIFQLTYERTRQREELLESVSLQKQIMDNISIPILLLDLDYRVMAANPRKKINVDMPLEQLLGTHCYDNVCKFGAPPEFCAVQETMKTQKPSQREFSFGGKRLISSAQPIFDLNGKMQYILSLDLDITEVTRQKEELKAAMEQAQAANRAKSTFLATVSHELRTPLNVVIGFSELLRNGGVDAQKQQEYLSSISFAGNALLGLINDVLDISNLEADTTQITPTRNDVAELIRQIAAIFATRASEKKIGISTSTGTIDRYLLYVDDLRLRQILLNLVGNAIKFTSEGRVSIDASFAPEDGESGTLAIAVSDSGIGIAPENQERIFEPFIHDSIIRGKWMYEGSGLGLTITRKLLDKMGGTIRLESEPGKGSTFTIRFEKIKYEAAPESPPSPGPVTVEIPPNRNLRFLLVDDVPLNLKVLSAMLKLLQIECVSADSAESAIVKLREDGNFDLILTDLWMPGCSGAELTRMLREQAISALPVVAVTADTQISEQDRELFAHILYKPITVDSLRQMLKTVLP